MWNQRSSVQAGEAVPSSPLIAIVPAVPARAPDALAEPVLSAAVLEKAGFLFQVAGVDGVPAAMRAASPFSFRWKVSGNPPAWKEGVWPLNEFPVISGTQARSQPLSSCSADSAENLLLASNPASLVRGCGIRPENQKKCLRAGTNARIAAFVNCRSAHVNNASFDGYGDLLQKGLGKRKFPPHSGVMGLKMLADGGKNV